MPELTLLVADPAGLHARPAARFVQAASRFESRIVLRYGGREADAKSLIALLGLTVRPSSEIVIAAEGPDADAAIAALAAELAPYLGAPDLVPEGGERPMSSPTISQKFTAEIIGTAILVFIGAGSVPLTVFLTGENPFGSSELSTISFCFAFAIFAAVYAVGHISGAHINPAVTIALLATRKIDSRTAGIYVVAQVIGAIFGAILTYIILIGNDPVTLGLGAVTYNAETSGVAIALAAEIIGTAILVFTVFGAAVDGRAPAGFAGIIIGFIVYGIIILVGPITGAALNPARQFGPELVQGITAPRPSGSSSPSTSSARSSVA